jgi:hypothetical protein
MVDYSFKLNNITDEKYQPKELEALEIKASFDNLSYQPNITATELTLINEGATAINNYIDGALNGTTRGIFEGIPYEILLLSENPPYNAFKGHLDLLSIKRKCDEVKIKLISDCDLQKFSERAQAVTYGYLEDTAGLNLFPASVLTAVPYCINYIPDGIQLIMIGISLYLMSKELYQTIPQIPEHIAAVSLAAIPTVGVPPSIVVGNIIIQSIKLALLLAYTVMIVIAIIKLIDQLFSEIYSIKRYYRACKISTLLDVGCQHLGYSFSSSIFNTAPFNELVFLPVKTQKGTITSNDSHMSIFSHTIIDDTGVPNSLGYGYTIYEIFELCMKMFNAKILIKNNTVYLEPKANTSFWQQNSSYILPDIEVLQKEYNTDELNPNYIIKYTYDTLDRNTIDNFTGTNYERITSPLFINDKTHLNFGGLKEIDLNVGLATRKETQSAIEDLLSGLATVVDGIIGVFGGNSNFVNGFTNRIGIMNVSEHSGWGPKVLLMNGNVLSANDRTYLSAKYLYQNYHYIDSFVADNYGGQYEIYKDEIIPFCFHDFLKTIESGYFQTATGLEGKFDEITWNFTQEYAKVSYRIKKPYTKNLQEIFIEP